MRGDDFKERVCDFNKKAFDLKLRILVLKSNNSEHGGYFARLYACLMKLKLKIEMWKLKHMDRKLQHIT